MSFVQYGHHGVQVWVREDLKGKHLDHCLCWSCSKFDLSDQDASCNIANALEALCECFALQAPVYECPQFDATS